MQQTDKLALISLSLGIASILVLISAFFISGGYTISIIMGILSVGAVVTGIISQTRLQKDPALRGNGISIAGIVCGLIVIALNILAYLIVKFFENLPRSFF